MKRTYTHHGREFITARTLCDVSWDALLNPVGCGRSPTKRVAIVRGSAQSTALSGKALINAANLRAAVSPGNRANLAASCHGSTSDRANPERTLIDIPFPSSPIGANRKSLNSDGGRGIGTGRSILATDIRRPSSNKQLVMLFRSIELRLYWATNSRGQDRKIPRHALFPTGKYPIVHPTFCVPVASGRSLEAPTVRVISSFATLSNASSNVTIIVSGYNEDSTK